MTQTILSAAFRALAALPSREALPAFVSQFPDFDPADMPAIPAVWRDASWRNDISPHFVTPAINGACWSVWVDYASREEREFPEMDRYTVYSADEDGAHTSDQPVYHGDDWPAVLSEIIRAGL